MFNIMQVVSSSDYLFRKNSEGKEQSIYYTIYAPASTIVRATLLVLHGMQEHSGRYKELGEYFAQNGFAVLTYDHLGHGNTAKNLSEHGYFQMQNPVGQLVEDTSLMAEKLHTQYPNVPHFILGHSMGSFIARSFLQQHSETFTGSVIVGTGGKIPGIGIAKWCMAILNRLIPHRRSTFVNNTFSRFNSIRFRKDPDYSPISWLSLNPFNRKNFEADRLNGIPFSFNGYHTLVSVNKRATEHEWAHNIRRDFPMLYVSGSEDPIGNFGRGVLQTTNDLIRQGFNNIAVKLYPKMRHEILNEEIRQDVFAEILQWLETKM